MDGSKEKEIPMAKGSPLGSAFRIPSTMASSMKPQSIFHLPEHEVKGASVKGISIASERREVARPVVFAQPVMGHREERPVVIAQPVMGQETPIETTMPTDERKAAYVALGVIGVGIVLFFALQR